MTDWRNDIESEFGKDVFYSAFGGEVVSSGSFIVDFLTGLGGFPLGGVVEICGTEGSGKTTLGLEAVKTALSENRSILWLDFERTLGEGYLKKIGIDPNSIRDYLLSPDTMEDGWMMINRFCENPKNRGGLVVCDSVAAMPPISDVEKMKEVIGQVRVASMAQVMSNAFRQMVNVIRKAGIGVIFTNQERSLIDTTGRATASKTTPGGAALKFYSAIRLKLEVRSSIKEDKVDVLSGSNADVVTALEVVVTVLKNKLAPSYRRGKIYIRMDEGVDNLLSAMKIAEFMGWLSKKGSYYFIDKRYSGDTLGEKKEHGFERVRKYFITNPEIRQLLMQDVKGYLQDKLKGVSNE